jgi:hypothetical protein
LLLSIFQLLVCNFTLRFTRGRFTKSLQRLLARLVRDIH